MFHYVLWNVCLHMLKLPWFDAQTRSVTSVAFKHTIDDTRKSMKWISHLTFIPCLSSPSNFCGHGPKKRWEGGVRLMWMVRTLYAQGCGAYAGIFLNETCVWIYPLSVSRKSISATLWSDILCLQIWCLFVSKNCLKRSDAKKKSGFDSQCK